MNEIEARQYLEWEFARQCERTTGEYIDMREHLPYLRKLAGEAWGPIAEFGTRSGNSTLAFALGILDMQRQFEHPLLCHDLTFSRLDPILITAMESCGIVLKLTVCDTAKDKPLHGTEVGLLLIDTAHAYGHVLAELNGLDVMPDTIVFHDTELFGWHGDNNEDGILPAILEWMQNKNYRISYYRRNCCGLLAIRKP